MVLWGSLAMIAAGAVVLPILWFIPAPYGRHARTGWGPMVNARWTWLVMESPSAFLFLYLFLTAPLPHAPSVWLLGVLFAGHYIHRTIAWPLLMRNPGKKPISVAGMAVFFNVCNATLNATALSELDVTGAPALGSPRLIAGTCLFLAGFALNVHSDAVLRHLRKPGGPRYVVPIGGGFRYVTSPNYLGEIIEWTGFALAAGTLPAIAFALFTIANLLPRARTHHDWYREQFPDYPADRRILIPGVF